MKSLYVLIRDTWGTYFTILCKTLVWRAALVHIREMWSSKHNLSYRVTPNDFTSVIFIGSFVQYNSKFDLLFRCLEIIVWNLEGVAFILFVANQSRASLSLASRWFRYTFWEKQLMLLSFVAVKGPYILKSTKHIIKSIEYKGPKRWAMWHCCPLTSRGCYPDSLQTVTVTTWKRFRKMIQYIRLIRTGQMQVFRLAAIGGDWVEVRQWTRG